MTKLIEEIRKVSNNFDYCFTENMSNILFLVCSEKQHIIREIIKDFFKHNETFRLTEFKAEDKDDFVFVCTYE